MVRFSPKTSKLTPEITQTAVHKWTQSRYSAIIRISIRGSNKNREGGMKTAKFIRVFVMLGAVIIGSACILEMAGPASTPQVIVVTATLDGTAAEPSSQGPDLLPSSTLEWTATLTQTFTPSLTATFTIAPVTMTAGQALSCVTGPDWKLYEWVAGIADGETVTLVARAVPEIPDNYVVRKSNGTECWAFGGSSAISGSTAALPIRETPPLPTVNFVIQNRIQIPLCDVFIRKAGESSWGADRLVTPPVVVIGGDFTLPITAGYYDVLVRDCGGPTTMYEAYNRAIGSDSTYRILEIAVDVDFFIQNSLPYSVCHIQTRTAALPAWQDLYNHDTGGSFAVGTRKDFRLRAGFYDVRITRCTDAVLPLTTIYVRPGVGGFTWA
jgi:hypothetical protein